MARKRRLSPDEEELWARVRATAKPMHPVRRDSAPLAPKPPKSAPEIKQVQSYEPGSFRIGGLAGGGAFRHDLAPSLADRLAHQPVRMDHKTHREMLRGKLRPEARIDLHGMTLAVAHPALTRFVMGAHAAGRRLVLVITGKGKPGPDDGPIPVRQGALRHQVPHWLTLPPMGAVVLQVTPAHLRHGGSGAYYVYLRR